MLLCGVLDFVIDIALRGIRSLTFGALARPSSSQPLCWPGGSRHLPQLCLVISAYLVLDATNAMASLYYILWAWFSACVYVVHFRVACDTGRRCLAAPLCLGFCCVRSLLAWCWLADRGAWVPLLHSNLPQAPGLAEGIIVDSLTTYQTTRVVALLLTLCICFS